MGNVNESKEQEDCFSLEGTSDTSSINVEFINGDELTNGFLEQDALTSDLPIKLYFASGRSASDVEVHTSDPNPVTTPLETANATSRNSSERIDEDDSDAEVSRDDSFPLSESALPSSFDLLVESSPALTDGSDIFHTPDISQLDIVSEENILITEFPSASVDNPENQITVSQSTEEFESQPAKHDKLDYQEASVEPSLASFTVPCSIIHVASPIEAVLKNEGNNHFLPLHEPTILDASSSDLVDATCIHVEEEIYPQNTEPYESSGDSPHENQFAACAGSPANSYLLAVPLVSQDITKATTDVANLPCLSGCGSNEHNKSANDHPISTALSLQSDHGISKSSPPTTGETSKSEPESDIGESFKTMHPLAQVGKEEKSDQLAPETTTTAASECHSTSELCMAHTESQDICDHPPMGAHVFAENLSASWPQSSWPPMSPEDSVIFFRDITESIFAACDGIENAALSDAQSAADVRTFNDSDISFKDHHSEQAPVASQHSADRPNWALAPRDSQQTSTNAENEQNSMTGSQQLLSLEKTVSPQELGTQLAAHSRRRPNRSIFSNDATMENMSAQQSRHNSGSRRGRPGRKMNAVVDKYSTHTRPRQSAYEDVSHNTPIQPKLQDSHPPNKPPGLGGRRPHGGSVSFSQNTSAGEIITSAVQNGPELSPITESSSISHRCTENHVTHFNPNVTNRKEESVEEKIAAIISETRRSKYRKGQQSHLADASKTDTIPRKTSLANIPKADTAQRGKVSLPLKQDEEVLQTNVRPPLLWRTGIGRALSTHLASAETLPKAPHNFEDHNKRKSPSDTQHTSRRKSLQVGHEDFPLHTQEYNEPVKVNLPTPPKQLRMGQQLEQANSDMASNAPARSNSHSSTPVATRAAVNNKPFGLSDNDFTSSHMTSEQAVHDVWRSVQGSFPLVPPLRRGPVVDPSALNPHSIVHMNHVSQQSPPLRNVQSFPTLPRMSEYDSGLNHMYSGNRYPSQNFLPQMMQNANPGPYITTVADQQPRSFYPALQRSNSRDLLSQTYDQGQHRERAFVQQTVSSGSGSTVSADRLQAINDLRDATVEGWITNFALGYPQHPGRPHGLQHANHQSATSLTPPQFQQQRPQRHFSELNENPVNHNRS